LIVSRTATIRKILWQHRWLVVGVVAITASVEALNDFIDLNRPIFTFAAIGLLVTALSISLVFRMNEAYARWWEARTLWGVIVNESRSWARQVTSLVRGDGGERGALRRRLVHRQIAYVNALRLRLRRQSDPEALAPFLEAEELEMLSGRANLPIALLEQQAEEVAILRASGDLDRVAQHRLETTLSNLTEAQGGCDRIKGTDFPDRVAYFTRVSAWLMAVIIPVLVLKRDNYFDVVEFVFVPCMMLAFLLTERLGAELKKPFENLANDTPMTALCRSIEIELRETLGETEIPDPIEPVDGVLM
jgi:putative membrane protein